MLVGDRYNDYWRVSYMLDFFHNALAVVVLCLVAVQFVTGRTLAAAIFFLSLG